MSLKKVGVLALQGAFVEHVAALRRLGVEAVLVRLPEQLEGLDGLVIPGGESTTISRLMHSYHLVEPIKALAGQGKPIWGTCAGMILMAKQNGAGNHTLGLMDVSVKRNAFGRQVDSFEADLPVPALGEKPFRAIFIRAPLIEKVGGDVEVLSRLDDGTIVAARQKNFLVCSFHPELNGDRRFHEYFLRLIADREYQKS